MQFEEIESNMAKAVRQSPRAKKWNVVRENGVIEHRGVSEREALILAKRLSQEEEAEERQDE